MMVSIHADDYAVTPAIKAYVYKQFQKLEKLNAVESADINLGSKNKGKYTVSIRLYAYGEKFMAEGGAEDLYMAINQLITTVKRQLTSHKEQLLREV